MRQHVLHLLCHFSNPMIICAQTLDHETEANRGRADTWDRKSGHHAKNSKNNQLNPFMWRLSWTVFVCLLTCSCLWYSVSFSFDVLCFVSFSDLGGDQAKFTS